MSSGKVLASVLAGAAAGAVLGILFAPDKGSETRKKLAEKGSGLADNLKSRAGEYADVLSEKYEEVKGKVMGEGKDLYNKAKENANSMKADVRGAMNG